MTAPTFAATGARGAGEPNAARAADDDLLGRGQAGRAQSLARTEALRSAEAFGLDLAGDWRFSTGDDMAWAEPGFDDSGWETRQVPQEGGQPDFASYDGYAWFRLEFTLPAEAKGEPLVAALGSIDDADEAFLNGELIGRTGSFTDDSQWFEQRLYPVPASAPNYGGKNVLSVRMNDFTGGGGWYRGPVGIFSKAALRTELYGLKTTSLGKRRTAQAQGLLDKQAKLIKNAKFKAYGKTLTTSFFHDGDSRSRRVQELRYLKKKYGSLRLRDSEVEILKDTRTGSTLIDTNREIRAKRGGKTVVAQERAQHFLYVTKRGKERGNRSRFYIDSVHSKLEGKDRDFAVYLPPSYLKKPKRAYPTIYLLHGINGGAAEWDTRDFANTVDAYIDERDIAESIIVMPDGESLWYIDSSVTPWRSMFTDEMLPLVDREYRTKPRRGMRGLTGISMGGHGAFTIGWANPELFSSIATHIGALFFPPLVGGPEEIAANSPETPTVQVVEHSTEFLRGYEYFFDACENDEFAFDDAARQMDVELTAKDVPHTWEVYPTGVHNDECWYPTMYKSFGLHSANFRAHGLNR